MRTVNVRLVERVHVRRLLARYELRQARGDRSPEVASMLARLRGRLAEFEGQMPLRPSVDEDGLLALARERYPTLQWRVADYDGHTCLHVVDREHRVALYRFADLGESAGATVEGARAMLGRLRPLEVG